MMVLDSYSRRARLAPVAVAALPAVALIAGGVFALQVEARLIALTVGAVGIVACALVRDAGHRAQARLWADWDGSPTLTRLRFRSGERPDRVKRLHARLETLLGVQLPTSADEAADPGAADDRYNEAVAALRQVTRSGDAYKLIAAENADYGFRRNLFGIRPFAVAVAVSSGLVALIMLAASGGTLEARVIRWGPGSVAAVLCLLLHWRVVSSNWVRLAAERYADRLFEAVPSAGLAGKA
jgi:hypothetical protein